MPFSSYVRSHTMNLIYHCCYGLWLISCSSVDPNYNFKHMEKQVRTGTHQIKNKGQDNLKYNDDYNDILFKSN